MQGLPPPVALVPKSQPAGSIYFGKDDGALDLFLCSIIGQPLLAMVRHRMLHSTAILRPTVS